MYYTGRNMRQQGGLANYLMPFLIIICIGIIGVLLFSLWNALMNNDAKKAAYMHMVSGSAEMRTWGTEDFFNISTDALIMQGDEIVTSADAKIIVEFFDGTIMRVDGTTDINFVEIDDESDPPAVNLLLVNGKVWFNKLFRETGDTYISMKTGNLEIISEKGSIFEVENGIDEIVRVFSGNASDVTVNISDKEGAKAIETETIGVGQEAVFSDAVLERYWQFQSPSVIAAINDEFKKTDWYLWNSTEDKTPTIFEKSVDGTQFVKVEPQAVVPVAEEKLGPDGKPLPTDGSAVVEPTTPDSEKATDEKKPTTSEAAKPAATLPIPTITNVAGVTTLDKDGYYVVSKNPAVLTGGVSGNVTKVVANDFVLKKFQPGNTTWSYFANASYDLMKEGANTYLVHTEDADGNKSPTLTVKVMYKPEKPAETSAPTTETPAATPTI